MLLRHKERSARSNPSLFLKDVAAALFATLIVLNSTGCFSRPPKITFAAVPQAGTGGPASNGILSGRVQPLGPDEQMVIYVRIRQSWWVQPFANQRFTEIHPDGSWSTTTHLGQEFAAILIKKGYVPGPLIDSLPVIGGNILAIARVPATPGPPVAKTPPPHGPKDVRIEFSGYQWDARGTPSPTGGSTHDYFPENVRVDADGALHLVVRKIKDGWGCAEVHSVRSLGYGTYIFHLRDIGHFEPAVMLSLNTWKDQEENQSHRELDIHVSRWGAPASKNAEYATQPYFVPSNVYRFDMPGGPIISSFDWQPGSIVFTTTQGEGPGARVVASRKFTTDVPTSDGEQTYISLCSFAYSPVPMQHEAEVVVDRFQFLP